MVLRSTQKALRSPNARWPPLLLLKGQLPKNRKGEEYMKKKMFILLVALMLLLSACAAPVTPIGTSTGTNTTTGTNNGSTTGTTTGSQVPATGYTTGNPGNVQLNSMGTMDPMPGFDAQNKYASMAVSSFLETDTFYIGSTLDSEFLRYYDKVTGISDYLCTDPACTHDSKDCGANVSYGAAAFYYDNQRWWIGSDGVQTALLRSDISGLNQVTVKPISSDKIILPYQPQQYAIHRGNLFFLGCSDVVKGAEIFQRYTLMASPLDGTEEFVTLFETVTTTPFNHFVSFVGTKVYYVMLTVPNPVEMARDLEIVTYDLATGAYETVYKESGIPAYIAQPWVTEQGEIYVPGLDDNAGYIWKLENNQRTLVTTFEDASSLPFTVDNVCVSVTRTDGIRSIDVRDFSGATLYQGLLFPEEIPGVLSDPNQAGYSFVGGDREKLILNLMVYTDDGQEGYIIALDIQNGMKATLLWSSVD